MLFSPHLCPGIEFRRSNSKMSLIRHCTRGRSCTYAHSKEEELYHPLMYKTKICSVFPSCDRHYCPFAHSVEEIRHPFSNPLIQSIWGSGDNNFSAGMQRWLSSPVSPLSAKQIHDIAIHQHPAAAAAALYSAEQHFYGVRSASSADVTPHQLRAQELPNRKQPFTPKHQSKRNPKTYDMGTCQSLMGHPSPLSKGNRLQKDRRIKKKEEAIAEQPEGADLHALLDSDVLRQALIMALAQQLIGPQVNQLSVDQIIIILDLAVKLAVSLQPSGSPTELHEQATTAAISMIDSTPPNAASSAYGGQTISDDLFGDATSSSGSRSSCRQTFLEDAYPSATEALIAQLKKLALSDPCGVHTGSSSAADEAFDETETSRISSMRGSGAMWSTSTSPMVAESSRSSMLPVVKNSDHLGHEESLLSGSVQSLTAATVQHAAVDAQYSEQKTCADDRELAERVRIGLMGALAGTGCQLPPEAQTSCGLPKSLGLGSLCNSVHTSGGSGQVVSLPAPPGSVQKRSADFVSRLGDDIFSPQTTTCSPSPFAGQVCTPQSRTAECTPAPPPSFPAAAMDSVKQALRGMQQTNQVDHQRTREICTDRQNTASEPETAAAVVPNPDAPKMLSRGTCLGTRVAQCLSDCDYP
ncbi:putative zinc finger, CCCH type domain protein [Toxoplasma gondii RUB]|uniref:Putative zinc finger, CCCH type domain protein n=1 Tax=Toxoplasma gondii RUB TaxID=935652 RepID=A0A086LW31_TOXGO|nr:putative zinc finger, CCCH type domain protein [Toxoplasma gondii RUB]